MLAIEGANQFRIRAYENAARTIFTYPKSIAEIVSTGGDLPKIPGIGQDLEQKIRLLSMDAPVPLAKQLSKRISHDLIDMTNIPGLGPKRVKALHETLKIESFGDLRRALDSGEIAKVRGIGAVTRKAIAGFLAKNFGQNAAEIRHPWLEAREVANKLVASIRELEGIKSVEVAGSYRRKKSTVGDLDILVAASPKSLILQRFCQLPDVTEVLSQGETLAKVLLKSGLQVDMRVVPEESYGAALHYFTGSKDHNISIRHLARERGLKINEYGIFRGEISIGGRFESDVFEAIGLPCIAPELRENSGEIEAARKGLLPTLVELSDIKGDLHMHTTATDGSHTLRQMIEAGIRKGYQYIAITDHSKRVHVAHGLDEARLQQQIDEIDAIQDEYSEIRILKGIEVDILSDGKLDLSDSILSKLDIRICSVHYNQKMTREKMTERILRAMDNPFFNVLGHPTGRLIGTRDAYAVDLEKIMLAAIDRGCFLEVNCQPARTDLMDSQCRLCKQLGTPVAISTDSHDINSMDLMELGINQARRGWMEKNDVLNTLPYTELMSRLNR
jgi:DNA polymerase (family 10)